MTASTTQANLFVLPKAIMQCGNCPHCGAPIYRDADIPVDDRGHLTQIPTPFFSCTCRLTLQPQIIPQIYPILTVDPQPASPWVPWNPQPTWIAKTFCGSGGVSQPDNKNIICLNGDAIPSN